MPSLPWIGTVTALCIPLSGLAGAEAAPAFNRDVLPILSDNCFACHGPDAPARKAGLRLDMEEGAKAPLPSGAVAVVPGDPLASALLQRITAPDPADRMPPPDSGKVLSETDRATLARWIEAGAAWQPHWAFITPERPALPAVKDATWPRNPIDRFILVRLEAEGIAPSPEADRYTLIRRVSLDLTGLPPSPEDVAQFADDPKPDAYGALVDRLLASPRYGEHMARYWLDLARYADTNGYAADIERTMWRYRDWVIAAFNANMPFDQFTIEQLAGDLLPDPTLDQRIATGFNRNNPVMMEGGAIFEEYRVQNVADRVDTTATTWLGLTMKCAQCHDHKYDPISQREFYRFYAFFNNVAEEESRLFGTERDGNSVPRIPAPLPGQQAELARLEGALEGVRAEMLRPIPEVDAAQAAWETEERARAAQRWTPLDATFADNTATTETTLQDCTALRLELLPAPGDHTAPLALSEIALYAASTADGGTETQIAFAASEALDGDARPAYDGNPETAWVPDTAGGAVAVFAAAAPFGFAGGTRLRVVIQGADAGRLRLSLSGDPAYLPATLESWRVSGPYVEATGQAALDTPHVDPNRMDLAATMDDGSPRWTSPADGLPDGTPHALGGKTCAYYFYRTITAPGPRRMDFALDNRNAVRLWVNGRLAFDKEAQRGEVGAHPAPAAMELREGENQILVKTVGYYDFNTPTFFFARKGEEVGQLALNVEAALLRTAAERSGEESAALRARYRSRHWDGWLPLHERERDLEWDVAQLEKHIPTTMVMEERAEPRPTHVLARGQYDQPGDPVTPGIPAVLHSGPEGAPRDRLDLAQWLVSGDNPLTARVVVNRYWQHCFGVGFVATAEDFGTRGERPSHPELLDWLARELSESGWDTKALLRLIVTSATYRQVSRTRPELAERDPDNRLLARGPRYRLEAEQIRDSALAASGLLVERTGGPSVKPYQPGGLWKDVAYGGGGQRYTAQEFIQDHGDNLYRRSLYTFWKRAAAPPGMLVFDAPNRDTCTARRGRSNTPLQALVLMNDVQYVEAARALASRVMQDAGPAFDDRIAYACLLALGRPPSPVEAAALRKQHDAQLADYRAAPEAARKLLDTGESNYDTALDTAELAAWTLVANALLNTDAAVSQF